MREVIIETPRLVIRNWIDTDRALFFEINSDPRVLRHLLGPQDRAQTDALMDETSRIIRAHGHGHFALERKEDRQPVGMCALNPTALAPHLPAGTHELAWRLAVPFWGQGYISEAAKALMQLGFQIRGLSEIVALTVPQNTRSRAVMERIGLKRDVARDFDHPHVPSSHPHLIRHIVYAITRDDWAVSQSGRPPA
jgi:RimJ/RimL family protein N-acetyltransferase